MTTLNFHKNKILLPLLIEKFNIKELSKVPNIIQIQLSTTSKHTLTNQNNLFNLLLILELLSLQKAKIIKAKQSVANFKLKRKTALGGKVTLTGLSIDKFINNITLINLPRVQIPGFTLASNRSADLGIKEIIQLYEIEVKADKLKTNYGLTITILIKNINVHKSTVTYLLNGLQIPLNLKI